MGTTVAQVIEWMDALAPPDLAEEWDNVGLHTGGRDSWVERVLVALTLESEVLKEARDQGAELILLHHPAIFRSIHHIRSDDPITHLLNYSIRSNIALYSAHTNLDRAPEGLNKWLAERLGLEAPEVLVPNAQSGGPNSTAAVADRNGLGRVGRLPRSLTIEECSRWVKARLQIPALRIAYGAPGELWEAERGAPKESGGVAEEGAGEGEREPGMPDPPALRAAKHLIERVAVVGGAGAGYWREALEAGADALVTGDVRYHEALDAVHGGLVVIDAGHYGTEYHFAEEVARYLRSRADKAGVLLDVLPSERGRDPFRIF